MDVRLLPFVLISLVAAPAAAAPFVSGGPPPVSVRVAASRAAVLVEHRDEGWAVVSVLHDATGTVRFGSTIRPKPAPEAGTRLALVVSNGDGTVESLSLTDEAGEYVSALPVADAPAEKRLAFALRHFDGPDEVIRADAFAELARLSATDFERHRRTLPAERLRPIVDDPDTSADRLGLYAYLLGLCGDESDAPRLRRRLLAVDAGDGFATGADGVAAGYLLTAGERGISDLEANVLGRPDTSPLLARAVLDALAFFRSQSPQTFRRDRLRRAACACLARADAADLAIGHLASGREWAALPDVLAVLEAVDENPDRRRAAQVAAVRFLLECRRDVDASAAVRSAADRMLSQVAANDSDLIRRATVLSGGVDARR